MILKTFTRCEDMETILYINENIQFIFAVVYRKIYTKIRLRNTFPKVGKTTSKSFIVIYS